MLCGCDRLVETYFLDGNDGQQRRIVLTNEKDQSVTSEAYHQQAAMDRRRFHPVFVDWPRLVQRVRRWLLKQPMDLPLENQVFCPLIWRVECIPKQLALFPKWPYFSE